ncbi:MAG: YceI family protein [Actinomycetota bacterium]|nr:YceI family protein [Actinomycetota bacterium]
MTTTEAKIEIPTGAWTSDPVHSSASFAVEHNGFSHFRTSFRELEATLVASDEITRLEGRVPVESIDVTQPDFRAHLLSPEFFDSARYPAIEFASDHLEAEGEGVTLRGELTIAGKSRPVEATGTMHGPLMDAFGGERISLSLEATLDRHEYGIGWNMDLPNGKKVLGDEVKLLVALELVKK